MGKFSWSIFTLTWSFISFAPFHLRGFVSLESTGLPRLSCPFILLVVISCPSGTTILIGAFAASICDLVTLFGSVNASDS